MTHIAVDIDDVVVDFFARVVKCYNKEFGESVSTSDITGWDINPVKLSTRFGDDKMFGNWWVWWQTRGLWSDCDAVDGAIGGLYDLHAAGHYIELLTSKPVWSRPDLAKWIHEWNPYYDRLTIIEEGGKAKKHEVSDAEVLIDDRRSNVDDWVADDGRGILFSQPWNTHYATGAIERMTRAKNWADVPAALDHLERVG